MLVSGAEFDTVTDTDSEFDTDTDTDTEFDTDDTDTTIFGLGGKTIRMRMGDPLGLGLPQGLRCVRVR
jgi:hypothetical protein